MVMMLNSRNPILVEYSKPVECVKPCHPLSFNSQLTSPNCEEGVYGVLNQLCQFECISPSLTMIGMYRKSFYLCFCYDMYNKLKLCSVDSNQYILNIKYIISKLILIDLLGIVFDFYCYVCIYICV